MDYYYPDRIADDDYDDENSSCCSAEIEGGMAAVDSRTANGDSALHTTQYNEQPVPNGGGSANADDRNGGDGPGGNSVEKAPLLVVSLDEEEFALEVSRPAGRNKTASNGDASNQKEQTHDPMAALIQNERNRRLGVRGADNANNENTPLPISSSETPGAPNSGGVLDNIIGWFGGGGAGSNNVHESVPSKKPPTTPSRRSSAPAIHVQNNSSHHLHRKGSLPAESQLVTNISYNEEDEDSTSSSSDESSSDDDNDSTSHSSNASNNQKLGDAHLTPQERARARALRHLSNSCVDARRKSKTASYVRGLERLDLKRKEDREAKELEVVEAEMNKDRGLINNNGGESDPISAMAARLVRELPRIQGADAGAGSDQGKNPVSGESFMTYDDYADALNNDNSTDGKPSLWENKEAVDVYFTSLRGRLKGVLERTRSLQKRLVVLEQAGDDIVSSLCEDLAEVTGHSNKAEARYVKKGKELQRKRRREELRHRSKIKQAERHIRKLEEQLLSVSGSSNEYSNKYFEGSDGSDGDSMSSGDDDDEDDEISLEKKLSTIKAKNEQDKEDHESEVESIRRQCEQLKLRLSVARLVMEGDDNLREYIALLERLNPSNRQQRNSNSASGDYHDQDFSGIHGDDIPSPPPSRITRARAKLLKVTHLEYIYGQRLAVSKAFTDATINALEQELTEREQDSQKMEVRCLNDLMLIDSGIKDIMKEASDKMAELESEAQELEDATAAFTAKTSIASVNAMFGGNDAAIELLNPTTEEEAIPMVNEPSNDSTIDEKDMGNDVQQVETGQMSDADSSQAENGIVDESETSKPATGETIPVLNASSRERSIDETQVKAGLILDGDSCQVENDIVDESEPSKPATGRAISMDNESSSLIDDRSNDKAQVETGLISGAESLQIENDIVDASSLPDTLQNSCDSIEKVPPRYSDLDQHPWKRYGSALSAATDAGSFDADDIEAPYENIVRINHDVEDLESSDEAIENGDHGYNNSGFSFSKETENDSPSPPQNEELVDTEKDFEETNEAKTAKDKNIVANGVSSYDERDATQCKPQLECLTDQVFSDVETNDKLLASNPSLIAVIDLAADVDHMPEGYKDGRNETTSELPSSNTDPDTDLRSGSIVHDEIIETEDGDEKEEKLSSADPQKKAVVEMLGRELKCTLAEYQTSFDLSSSSERIEQLECMNDLVSKIAKVRWGIECPNNQSSGESELRSWSLKKSHRGSSDQERHEKKRSKSKKKKSRRRGNERKEVKTDAPDDELHLEHSLIW